MNCSRCGTAAHPLTPYCVQCGTPIPNSAPAVAPPGGAPAQYAVAPAYAPQPAQYAPPQPQYVYPAAPAIPYANFGVRLIALIIDEFLAFSVAGMAGGLVVAMGMLMALVGLSTNSQGGTGGGIAAGLASYLLAFPVMFFVYLFYFVKLETSDRQATFGKMMFGIKIVDASTGAKISVGQSLGRFFVKNLFSGWFFCIGFLMALFTDKKQALHDMAGSTLVVQK
jgi:uncharacterized RDD family membrane protein YckC